MMPTLPSMLYTGMLTVNKAGYGSGLVASSSGIINCGATCTGTDTSLTLTATPDNGSIFTGWSGGGCAGTGTCTIVMSSDATVTANFDTILPWVTVNPVSNPSKTSTQTLTGTMKAGSTVTLSANTAAAFGALTYPTSTSWQCNVTNLAIGTNNITVTATNQSGIKQANLSVTYDPFVVMTLSTPSIAADYQGSLGITVSSINPAGSEVLIEQLVDANRNGVVDAGDYVIRSFKVTDGISVANLNKQGDTDGIANGTVTTTLNHFLTSDLYHAPGHYIFKVTKGTETATAPFVVDPVSQVQTVSGIITNGINPIPGATVRLLDKWQRPVAWTTADGSGAYVLNIKQPGDYFLTPITYGYVAPATPITIAASQSIVNQTLTLTAGTYHITGKVIDAVSSTGIGGVWVQAKGTNTTGVAITNTNGSYDLALPAGQYAINTLADTTVPGTFVKGYPSFNNHPLNVTVNGNAAGMDIALTNGDIHVSGRVLDQPGNPVQGLPVAGRIRQAIDVREPVNLSISDAAGNYSLDLFSGTNWDISLDNTTAQSLGYLGTITHDLSTAVGPLTGHDLTVHPITAWIQGTVKDSTSKLLSGIEVQLHNADSSITTSVITAPDGTYRLSAFAGTWFIDALTTAKGLPAVPEQPLALTDTQTATNNFTVDVTAPTVTITSPAAGITNNPKPALAYTVSDGTVVVKVDGVIVSKLSGDTLDFLANGQHTVRVESTDTAGNLGFAEVTFTVNYTPLTISTSSLTDGYLTSAYNQTLMATGGKTPYSWSITSTTKLPTGLTLNTSTGVISGTPTATVTNSSITFQVKDADTTTTSKIIAISVYALPSISTSSLPNGTVGTAYSATLTATSGKSPYTWSITSTTKLPAGLTLDASTGVISGTPTATVTNSSITFQAADSNGKTASKALSITINAAPLAITSTTLPDGYLTIAYSSTLTATGGKSPYTWSITSKTKLPAGLTLNTTTGVISGTPTATVTNSSITFQAKDANNTTASKVIPISVYALPSITTISLPGGTIGTTYNSTLAGTGGKTAYTWNVIGSVSLPADLTLNNSTGAITGTPTTAGTSNCTFQVADANGKTASKALAITIAAPTVAQLNAWTNIYSGAPNNTSATNLAAGSLTVGTGTNRLLLVAVVMEIGTAANPTISASYGGTALTLIKATTNTQREIIWVGYLKESQIGSGTKALTVSYSGATGNVSALHVKWAAFSGVNQTSPTASFGGVNTNTTSASFGSTINYINNGMTTVVAGNGGTPATGTLSATPAFTAGTATTTNAQTSRTFTATKHTVAGSYASTTPVTWTGTTSAWSGLVVVSLQP